ncbi:MAG: 50S ribosomal protein L3 [Oscillospiraceae bacterium]|jgi:large subunit ribosomal protein L3|nr:50S ribosomal protein L3 [Oscillospiraceae bacterium]
MKKGIIARKIGMTQIFGENGKFIPVTVLEAGPCPVVQLKTERNDGYAAVQLGFGDLTSKHVKKPIKGHFDKANVAPKRRLKEFRLVGESLEAMNIGDLIKADIFEKGERVDIAGTSKGKGFSGTIKRWNGHRLKASHGTGPNARHAGSNGAATTPGRVFKGKKLPGHLGAEAVTVQNLEVVKVDAENNLIALKGAVPGPRGGIVYISDSVKA